MILRVFWPDNSSGLVQQNSPCLLLGAILNSTQQAQAVTSAVVVSVIPLDLLDPLLEVQKQLSKTQVALSAQPGFAAPATLAVLGVWLPQKQNQQHHCTDDATRTAEAAAANLHGLWLVLRGQQSIHHTLGCSWRAQQTTAPDVELQQCVLPSNTQSIQLMVYSVPAQQPGFAHVQLPRPPPAPQLPWMNREPGAVSLSTVMHMLQEAHAALQASQSAQLQEHEQAQAQTLQQQPQGQQARTRQQLRRAQQLQGQQQHATAPSLPDCSTSTRHGWVKLAAVVWAAERRRPRSWITQQWAFLAAGGQHILRRMAAYAPAATATHLTAGVNIHHPHTSTAAAAGNAAGNAAGPVAPQAAAASTGQPYLLQLVVQHLLGLLVALNLLLHRQVVLNAAAAAGAWLQEDILQPHITWISQAHPGGIKLHLELSVLLGTAAEACLNAAAALYSLTWPVLGPTALTATAAAAAVGGASWGCAAAADVLLVVLGPLVLVYLLAAQMQQLHLTCLSATWRLIRGKQKVRRFSTHHRPVAQQPSAATAPQSSRPSSAPGGLAATTIAAPSPAAGTEQSASDEVSVEQLIVGVLLFTPLLGLLPTTAAWYLSACALHACLTCLRLLLLGVGSWLQLRPLHVLAARWRQPLLFPGQLMLLPCSPAGAPTMNATSCQTSAAAVPAADDAGGGGGGARCNISSSSRRKLDSASSSKHEQQDGASPGSNASAHLAVSTYHVFYEPCGYWEVLVQSITQQQGLLWYACQGPGSIVGGSRWAWVRRWVMDVAVGRVWGLRMLSSRWRQL